MDVSQYLSEASFWMPDQSCEPLSQALFSPVAFWTVQAAQPKEIIQLGIRPLGVYFSLGEAVKRLGLGTRCTAVDAMPSRKSGAAFVDAAHQRARVSHDRAFGVFSKLVLVAAEEVVETFADHSIDLMVLADAEKVETFQRDLDAWASKLSDRAVLLLPRTGVQRRGLGSYHLFHELASRHKTFEFTHGDGFGLVAMGAKVPERLRPLFEAHEVPPLRNEIRLVYARLGQSLIDRMKAEQRQQVDYPEDDAAILGMGARGEADYYYDASPTVNESGLKRSPSVGLADFSAREENQALREENVLLREENSLLDEKHQSMSHENSALRQENPWLRHHLAHHQHHHAVTLDQLNRLQHSLGWRLLEKARRFRGSYFPETRLHGRCLVLATRFARIAVTVGPRAAVGKASRRVVRKIKTTLKIRDSVSAQTALESSPVYRSIVPARSTARFEDLPWTYTGARPLDGARTRPTFKILLVGHAACRTGAPLCLLRLSEELSKLPDVECWTVLRSGGELSEQFAQHAPTFDLQALCAQGVSWSDAPHTIAARFREFSRTGVAICNTMAVSEFHEAFADQNVPVLSWIHELPTFIDILGGKSAIDRIKSASRHMIVPADVVRSALIQRFSIEPSSIRTLYYGLDAKTRDLNHEPMRARIRAELGLPDDARIVVGCGTIDLRKGADLFVQMARQFLNDPAMAALAARTWFIWVGHPSDPGLRKWLAHDIEAAGFADRIRFLGTREDMSPYFLGADVFALTSREDPCPFANLEAMESSLAVVAFQGSGGAPEVLGDAGIAVPYLDANAMAKAVRRLLTDHPLRSAMGRKGRATIRRDFTWPRFMDDMLGILRSEYDYRPAQSLKVSVIVPNYRHAAYLEDRLRSIFEQTVRPHEIIVLDDASPDDSVEVVKRLASLSPVPIRVVVNQKNSGSTFKQWMKGFEMATGDLVWIAESDDCSHPEFLERLLPEFHDRGVALAYCQSALIGPEGQVWVADFLAHTNDLSPDRWRSRYSAEGTEEAEFALSQKNTIPNASAVVFRRSERLSFAEELAGMRFAGDWLFYAMQIRDRKIAFVPDVLNFYRRHEQTVSHQSVKADTHAEETLHVKARIFETFSVSANAIARSLGQTLLEYNSLTERFGLKRPPLMANARAVAPLNRIREILADRVGGRPDLKVLLVIDGAEKGVAAASMLHLADALARDHQVFLCCVAPVAAHDDLASRLDGRVILLEGTLGDTPWSGSDSPAGALNRQRIEILRELIRFHRIDVIHSRFVRADQLVLELNSELNIPWFIHLEEGRDGWLDDESDSTEDDRPSSGALASISGIFHESQASLKLAEKWPVLAGKRWIKMFSGFQPDALLQRDPIPISKRDGDFLVYLIDDGTGSKLFWKEAMDAVQIVNRMPSAERADRRVRLVLPDAAVAALKRDHRHHHLNRMTIPAPRAIDPLALLAQCDAALAPHAEAANEALSLVAAALACNVPVIAPDRGVVHDMLAHDRRRAGIFLPPNDRSVLDVDRMVSALLRYLKQPELHGEHSDDARRIFDERFHIDRTSAVCTESYFHARDFLIFPREPRVILSIQDRSQGFVSRESA
ncbi:glycosyltransferase [Paludisphaera borealis]|uniref:GT2 and GT4 families glycosyltransferase n=1 Tax=Paludisphaera borealis TaxID=1387353 RepID=A0A1U7CMX1_9BACT|nr:glycosyltransferase [Paludisphaera borealis]APW60259.1 GT2 and GT4 families glycosyltransferase [Paludisphaera borealis]